MPRIYIVSILIVLAAAISSCKKLVTVGAPTTSIETATVFSDDASAAAAVSGIYSRMMGGYTNGISAGFASGNNAGSVTFYGALSADELINYPPTSTSSSFYLYGNSLLPADPGLLNFWKEVYQFIYTANAGIEGLADSSSGVSPAVRARLSGECKFIRAFCYFYMTNLFGDVPLITTTNYAQNQYAARTPQAAVYSQIIADLTDAEKLLNADYAAIDGGERVRPIKWAAAALLARTYLYMGKWSDAEAQASLVINSGQYTLLKDLTTVFLKNSRETIWSLRPVMANQNTPDALTFLLTAAPSTAVNNVSLPDQFLAAFEAGDKRRSNWINSLTVTNTNPALNKTYYFPYKYRVGVSTNAPLSEYSMVLRIAEQYLIRAEARAKQDNLSGATSDIDTIRSRAGLIPTTAATQKDILSAVLHERQTELFTEWGHRWLDLKRTNSIDSVMKIACPLKGTQWKTTAQLWPIPQSERNADHYLSQNLGYN